MQQYKLISKKGEGTFSEVLQAQSLKTEKMVAIKCMKNHFNSINQVNHLREIQALRKLSPHEHIIKLIEILYDEPTGRLALVFELFEQNLYEYTKGRKQYLPQQKVKWFMYQLLKALDHMHNNGIFHRDIKPENILLLNDHIKLADFGSCKGMYSEHPYTEYISTRWYRAPECLLTDGYYDFKMDLWGVGCVMFEIIGLFPLFPGQNEVDTVHKIHNILGSPDKKILDRFQKVASHMEFDFPYQKGTQIEKLIPHASKDCVDLLKQLLTYDPEQRISASQALKHDYFREFYQKDYLNPRMRNPYDNTRTRNKVNANRGGDTQTDEEEKQLHLPPIASKKEGKLYLSTINNKQKKNPYGGGTLIKQQLSNQIITNKYKSKEKQKKQQFQGPADYILYGKQVKNNNTQQLRPQQQTNY